MTGFEPQASIVKANALPTEPQPLPSKQNFTLSIPVHPFFNAGAYIKSTIYLDCNYWKLKIEAKEIGTPLDLGKQIPLTFSSHIFCLIFIRRSTLSNDKILK